MKVLIVRFAAIGDCVMTAWPVTALREALPDAHIVWALQERCVPVVEVGRLVDRVHVFPRDRWKSHRWSLRTWREQIVQYTALRHVGIDVGFDFQGHSKTALCLRLAGCKERYSSRATDALAARLNPPRALKADGPHEVELGAALVRCRFEVDVPERPVMPDCTLTEESWRRTVPEGRRLVSIQTGAGEADKRYPVSLWSKVATSLQSRGCHIVAVGGPSDPVIECEAVQNEVGKISLDECLGVVRASDVHLAADTGTGHAAAAYGTPVVSVFGRTDPARFRPWTKTGRVLRGGTTTADVLPDDVVAAAVELLEEAPVARPR